jgi:large subunit ribosomal protein LP0
MAPRDQAKLAKKNAYLEKLVNLFRDYPRVLVIQADHVGSKQFQEIRTSLRGRAEILMGKNTMIRTALRLNMDKEEYEHLRFDKVLDIVKGNIGFVFVKEGDLNDIRTEIVSNRVPAAARAGIVAQCDVFLPAGATGLDPSQTSFFQALNIATKIVKGQIELVSQVHIIVEGKRVGTSEAVLLKKLSIEPFAFGLQVVQVYDQGSVFDAKVLDLTDDMLTMKFMSGLKNIAAFSRELGVPCEAGAAHAVANGFRNIAALCAEIDFTFSEIETIKEFFADPSKFASLAVAAPAAGGGGGAPAAVAAAAAPEEEEEDMDFDLFG